jgi:hypothetical protein
MKTPIRFLPVELARHRDTVSPDVLHAAAGNLPNASATIGRLEKNATQSELAGLNTIQPESGLAPRVREVGAGRAEVSS